MYYFQLNVSDFFFYENTVPMYFDEFISKLIVAENKASKVTDLISVLTKDKIKLVKTFENNKDGLYSFSEEKSYIKVRHYFKSRIITMNYGEYDFIFNIEHKFLSISSKTDGFKHYFRKFNVTRLGELIRFIRLHMSSLCYVVENSPKPTPIKNIKHIADHIVATKGDKPTIRIPTESDKYLSESRPDKEVSQSESKISVKENTYLGETDSNVLQELISNKLKNIDKEEGGEMAEESN